MNTTTFPYLGVVQNLGLLDRVIRLTIAWSMIGYAAFDLSQGGLFSWHGIVILASVYPMITGMLGFDPVYAAMHAKSCDLSERNRCGTMPFEVASALGKHPQCSSEYDCHLQPRH